MCSVFFLYFYMIVEQKQRPERMALRQLPWHCLLVSASCYNAPRSSKLLHSALHSENGEPPRRRRSSRKFAKTVRSFPQILRLARAQALQKLSTIVPDLFHTCSTLKLRPKKQGLLPSASQKRWLHEASPALNFSGAA